MTAKRCVLIALTLGIVFATPLLAQTTGRIDGRVTGSDGRGQGGVSVVVHETKDATITDATGYYSFAKIAPGTYTVIFAQGQNSLTETGVVVTAGATAEVALTVD